MLVVPQHAQLTLLLLTISSCYLSNLYHAVICVVASYLCRVLLTSRFKVLCFLVEQPL